MVWRKSPMVSFPLLSNCSRVSTATGAGVVRSLRRMRDPVTTISSCMSRRSAAVGGAEVGTGGASAGAAAAGGAAGGVSCWATAYPAETRRERKTEVAALRLSVMWGPLDDACCRISTELSRFVHTRLPSSCLRRSRLHLELPSPRAVTNSRRALLARVLGALLRGLARLRGEDRPRRGALRRRGIRDHRVHRQGRAAPAHRPAADGVEIAGASLAPAEIRGLGHLGDRRRAGAAD